MKTWTLKCPECGTTWTVQLPTVHDKDPKPVPLQFCPKHGCPKRERDMKAMGVQP